ncbi:hypothetical protein SESBI_06415 [Sesbania bispinosa]|nr:hypothetical protein SESBI_06415 [Sesbania bispinosa]
MAPHSEKSQKKKKDKPKMAKASKKIFKPKREQNDAATAAAKSEGLALQLEDEVPDFPRGSESSFSPYFPYLKFKFAFGLD